MLSRLLSHSLKTFSATLRLQQNRITLNTPTRFYFTSSSNSSQVALLEEVEAKIFQVLKTAAKCNTAKLNKNATFEELGFDSLDTVQLVVAMEEYFGFDVPNEEAEKIATVQAAINTFYRHMNAKVANKIVENNNSNDVAPK